MSFGDIASRFKQARQAAAPAQDDKPYDHAESYRLRAKILGLLIRDARISAARTQDDCARLLNTTPEQIEAWEVGDSTPDLAQLELLAFYLDVPISHFWGMDALNHDPTQKLRMQDEYMALRHRMIGALLQNARETAGLTRADVAQQANLDEETLSRYELGEQPIPMHELVVLSSVVKRNMSYFVETSGYVGELLKLREQFKHFTELDEDIRDFAANPLNLGFIKIAMMFGHMPADQLRKVAEGLLEISM